MENEIFLRLCFSTLVYWKGLDISLVDSFFPAKPLGVHLEVFPMGFKQKVGRKHITKLAINAWYIDVYIYIHCLVGGCTVITCFDSFSPVDRATPQRTSSCKRIGRNPVT